MSDWRRRFCFFFVFWMLKLCWQNNWWNYMVEKAQKSCYSNHLSLFLLLYLLAASVDTWNSMMGYLEMKNLQFRFVSDLFSHQPQQVVDHVLFWAWQDVIFVQTALDMKSPANASHRHDQSQKSHHRSCVHGLKAVRRSDGIRWQRQREISVVW